MIMNSKPRLSGLGGRTTSLGLARRIQFVNTMCDPGRLKTCVGRSAICMLTNVKKLSVGSTVACKLPIIYSMYSDARHSLIASKIGKLFFGRNGTSDLDSGLGGLFTSPRHYTSVKHRSRQVVHGGVGVRAIDRHCLRTFQAFVRWG